MLEIIFTKDGVTTRQRILTPFGEKVHEEKIKYEELPNNCIKLIVTGIHPKVEAGALKELVFDVSHFEISKSEGIQKIEVTLPPSAIKYTLIDIPKRYRRLFPGYKVPFVLETNIGEIETYIVGGYKTDKVGDLDAGTYFSKRA